MLIQFGEINNKILILFIFPAFTLLRKLIINSLEDNYFFDLFRFYISYILSIIFIIIIKKRSRISHRKSKSIIEDNNLKNLKHNSVWINPLKTLEEEQKREKTKRNIIFTIYLVFIGLLTNLFFIAFRAIYNNSNDDLLNELNFGRQSIGAFFEIIYYLIFGKIILDNKIYRHHFISLIIILFNLMLLIINYTHYFKKKTLKVVIYNIIYNFLFCLSYVSGKKYLNIYYIPPYQLMVNIGLITSIIILIYDIITFSIINKDKSDFYGVILGFKNNSNFSNILLYITDIILYFFSNIGIWLTVYYFTPFHFIISESLCEYIYYTYDYLDGGKYEKADVLLYFFVYVINLFFIFVFNEIIILNFWGLSYNTTNNIKKREKKDIYLALQNPTESISFAQ